MPARDLSSTAAPGFGAYIHVPFCRHRCDYCAFATWTDKDGIMERYVDAVCTHIARERAAGMAPADTVFIGGGTPTRLPAELLVRMLDALDIVPGAEVTVECNPDDLTADLLSAWIDGGVNRVSLGVQSTVPRVLASLGRTHDPASVGRAVELLHASSLASFNLDVIYGAAGETLDEWRTTLADVAAYDPPHVSAYALTVEPGTPLADQPDRHPDDDDQADKYLEIDATMSARGLANYEISNWARPGHECRHNLLYWRQGNYDGFGCAAHSHRAGRRWWNVRTPDRYIELVEAGQSPESSHEVLDDETRAIEALQLSIRTRDGVPVEALPPAERADLDGLVAERDGRTVLTEQGRLMANAVSLRLVVPSTGHPAGSAAPLA